MPERPNYAGLWRRFAALVIDTLLFTTLFLPITRIVKGVWIMDASDHRWSDGLFITDPLCIIFLLVMFLYYAVLEGLAGATLGKWLMGMRVVRVDGPALSITGIVLILRSPEKARFGDRVAGTRVIRIR